MVVAAAPRDESFAGRLFCGKNLDTKETENQNAKTLPERIFFTIVMAAIMVYGMIVYNVALNTGGVTGHMMHTIISEMA